MFLKSILFFLVLFAETIINCSETVIKQSVTKAAAIEKQAAKKTTQQIDAKRAAAAEKAQAKKKETQAKKKEANNIVVILKNKYGKCLTGTDWSWQRGFSCKEALYYSILKLLLGTPQEQLGLQKLTPEIIETRIPDKSKIELATECMESYKHSRGTYPLMEI